MLPTRHTSRMAGNRGYDASSVGKGKDPPPVVLGASEANFASASSYLDCVPVPVVAVVVVVVVVVV